MNCPVCEDRMKEIDRNGVTVDICPSCKGVWLDKGELDKLLELSESSGTRSEVSSPGPETTKSYEKRDEHNREYKEYDRDYDRRESGERGYGERKRKGSWLGDILGGLGGDD